MRVKSVATGSGAAGSPAREDGNRLPLPLPGTPLGESATRLRLVTMRLHRRLRRAAGNGVTPSQLAVLGDLEREGAMGLRALAEAEKVQPPSITRVVQALEAEGLLSLAVFPADKRVTVAELTPAGRALLKSIRRKKDEWLAGKLSGLTPAQMSALEKGISVLEGVLGEE